MQNDENKELYEKFLERSLKEKMDKVSNKFKEFQQQAFYSDLQESAKKMIISIDGNSEASVRLKNHKKINYFIILGAKQSNHYEKFLLNLIHSIPLPHKTYSIIYINTLAQKNAFNDFMKVTDFLPSNYFLHLDQIYVLQASFMNKAVNWVSFNTITNFIKGKILHINDFEDLAKTIQFDQIELLKILPKDIQSQLRKREEHIDILLENKVMKLVTMEDMKLKQMKSETKEQKIEPKHSVSKSSIIFCQSKKPTKHELEDYQVGQTGAPLPLQMLIYYFNEREELLETQGIFRKSVSVDDQNEILSELQDQNYDFIESVTDPHVIANGMKRFLANLVTPVVPYQTFMKLMHTDNTNITEVTIECIKSLPEMRKMTIEIFLNFFQDKLIPREHKNKMGLNNVCIISGPCLMRSEVSSIKDLVYSQKIIAVMMVIFKQFDNIFGNKKERNQRLRKSVNKFKKAYIEERLGIFQSTINEETHQPCELTPSQADIIVQSRKPFKKHPVKEEDKEVDSLQNSSNKKIWSQVSATIKEELDFEAEHEEFYDIDGNDQEKKIFQGKKAEQKEEFTKELKQEQKGETVMEDIKKADQEEKVDLEEPMEEAPNISPTFHKKKMEEKVVPKSEIFDQQTEIINLEEVDEEVLKKYNQSI